MAASMAAQISRKAAAASSFSSQRRVIASRNKDLADVGSSELGLEGQKRKIIPLGQWVPEVAVDAYVAPDVVLIGQVTVNNGVSVLRPTW